MFDRLPFGLETYIYTLIPDKVFIYLAIATIILVVVLWRYRYHVLLCSYSVLLLCQTVIFRHVDKDAPYSVIPFQKLRDIVNLNVEACWEIGLNLLVFIPIGILLTIIVGKNRWRLSIAIGMMISMAIECLQLVLKRGVCETDDVIINTLGCSLGVCLVSAFSRLNLGKKQ